MDKNKRLTLGVEKETETDEILKKRRLQSPSSSITDAYEDLRRREVNIYSDPFDELCLWLPHSWLRWSQDWTYLLKCSGPSSNDYPSLWSDLASLCHWFLSTEAPESFKKGANQALKHIAASGTSLAVQMPDDHQSASYLLECVLDSQCTLLIQQACRAIAFLCWWYRDNNKSLSFSDGVLSKLFNIVDQDSPHLAHARHAICSIACVDKCVKDEIITKTKKDFVYKWPFLFGDTEEVEHACMIVACIVGGGEEKDEDTWYRIEGFLIPPIVNVMRKAKEANDIPVMVAAAYAISSAADGATYEQIDLLYCIGCLEVLCINIGWSPPLTSHILDGIGHILLAERMQGGDHYVNWIEYAENSPGWEAFYYVKDKYFSFPCFEPEGFHSIEYRAREMAYWYGGRDWRRDICCPFL